MVSAPAGVNDPVGADTLYTGLAQLVEHWSPKPGVGSSSLSSCAKDKNNEEIEITYGFGRVIYRASV